MAEPPLFAGCILGLRTWTVRVARNGDLRVCASFGDSLWEALGRREAMEGAGPSVADRSKCRVDAVVRTTRPLNELHLGIAAISHSGKNLGRATTVIHDVAKGTSRVKVREMRPWLCERPGPFLVRVRAVFGPLRAGHVAQVVSEPIAGVRSAGESPTR